MAMPKIQEGTLLDLYSLKDQELMFLMELSVQQLVGLRTGDDSLVRFWCDLYALLESEGERRKEEIKALERLYFRS